MRTIAVMNLKGGTAKTVTALSMASILARDYAYRVLLVDADSQANLTEFVSLPAPKDLPQPGGLADLLRGMTAYAVPTNIPNTHLIAADETLMALDVTAAGTGAADPMALSDWLEAACKQLPSCRWDWCVIDCPPAFSAGAAAALIAADEVVIPLKLDAFGVRGLANLFEQIQNMRRLNAGLEIAGVLPTMYYPSTQQEKTLQELKDSLKPLGIRVFDPIRRSPKVDAMTFEQIPIELFSPRSNPARDYRLFVRDLVKEGGEQDGV